MAIFVTSDLHFNHDKDFIYAARGFPSIKEHDEKIIENWISMITDNDEVYLLGDLIMGPDRKNGLDKINQLTGKIHLLLGNHDTDMKFQDYLKCCPKILEPVNEDGNRYAKLLTNKKWMFYMSHYPTIVGDLNLDNQNEHENRHPTRFYSLHGHTHSTDKFEFFDFKCYNVALDAHNMRPVSLDEIKNDINVEIDRRKKLAGGAK